MAVDTLAGYTDLRLLVDINPTNYDVCPHDEEEGDIYDQVISNAKLSGIMLIRNVHELFGELQWIFNIQQY